MNLLLFFSFFFFVVDVVVVVVVVVPFINTDVFSVFSCVLFGLHCCVENGVVPHDPRPLFIVLLLCLANSVEFWV